MAERGFCDDLPEDVIEMHERTARNLANLWANGCDGARVSILAALCRETIRMATMTPAPAVLPAIRPDDQASPDEAC